MIPLSKNLNIVESSILGTRAKGVSPAMSATRHKSSRMSIVNGPCSLSKVTKSNPALPASSTIVVEGNIMFMP